MNSPPASWKTKCTIRRADELARADRVTEPVTDGGTLIMRSDALPAAIGSPRVRQTVHYPSLPPMAIDLEDHEPPARNSDALGMRSTMPIDDLGRSVTSGSFAAGLLAGLMTLACGGALAYASFTDALGGPAHAYPVHARTVESVRHELVVERPEAVPAKAAPKKVHHRARAAPTTATDEEAPAPAAEPEAELPTSSER